MSMRISSPIQAFVSRAIGASSSRLALLATLLVLAFSYDMSATAADPLPAVTDKAPLIPEHFPDVLHAVVWRNWQLVEPTVLASVLCTRPEKVTALAESMGLPCDVQVPPEMRKRGYITLLRRNWHLLPYEQLVQLLGVTPEELAFRLREDDFLYVKLGSMKPKCEPVAYHEPDEAAQQREAEIRALVQRHFGDRLQQPGEPRFAFIDQFKTTSEATGAVRQPSDEPLRFIYSYFAMFGDSLADPSLDSYPDGLLAALHQRGVNGIWLHTVLRQLAPGGPEFPEFGGGHEERLANLRKLVARAKRHGIDVYLYVNEPRAMPASFFKSRPDLAGVQEGEFTALCTSRPVVRKWLSDSLAYVFREVPGLGGVFTITASENLTNCASHYQQANCPHCRTRTESEIIAEVIAAIDEGVHRSAPTAKVIAYDWGWKANGDATENIAKLPASTSVMSVSEWSLPIERGGVHTAVGEYSISAVGPGPRAELHWSFAHKHGLKTVAKVQLNNSWELSSVPYLPVLDLVAEHCTNLRREGVDGMMLSWSLGGYPSINLEAAQLIQDDPQADPSAVLDQLAEKHFGPRAAPHIRKAWAAFSEAFRQYPYNGAVLYNAPQQMGPANLLYRRATGFQASMVGIPYDDLDHWRGPYPANIFAEQFQKVADRWADGLTELTQALPLVPVDQQAEAAEQRRVARAAQIHFASAANQARFIMAREALSTDPSSTESDQRRLLLELLDQESSLATQLFDLATSDSRLGYEASNHYFYVPLDLVEKVVCCDYLKQSFTASVHRAAAPASR
jgi:hypothetical protein